MNRLQQLISKASFATESDRHTALELAATPSTAPFGNRPEDCDLRIAVRYLERIGLAVYGPAMDLDTGTTEGANMDYDPDQVVKYRALKEKYPEIPFVEDDDRLN